MRRQTRENAFKLIYERSIVGEKNPISFNGFWDMSNDKDYLEKIYNGVDEKMDFLNRLIERFSVDFKLERVYKVDYSILCLAIYEILFMDDIPDKVAINEALELSKIYSTQKSSVFINGLLASIVSAKDSIIKMYNDELDSESSDSTKTKDGEENGENN